MSKPVIVLDPGHGGYDPGAVAYGLREKELNLKLALKVAGKLSGVKVLLTRESDVFVSLVDRVAFSRRAEPDLFLSLHANAGGGRGFESFICSRAGADSRAFEMQGFMHGKIIEALEPWAIIDRGLKKAAFYVLRHNPHPAVLIESLFIDNEREAGLWRDPVFVETLADGVVSGIEAALELPAGSTKPEDTGGEAAPGTGAAIAPGTTLYTVQVGAFAYIENARMRLDEARMAGFEDAFIYQKRF